MKIRHLEIRHFRGIRNLSWRIPGDFNCIIGPGDSCKSTILTAIEYALSPRTALTFDDADFYDQDVTQEIAIQVTLAEWDENLPEIRDFFRENKFAQFKCGMTASGPVPEPGQDAVIAISVSLRVDGSLEPRWFIAKGRDDNDDIDKAPIYAVDRAVIGASRLDLFSDSQFTWGRNTILTRLTEGKSKSLNTVLATLTRDIRKTDLSSHQSIAECQNVADSIKQEAQRTGVRLSALSPRIDIQRQSVTAGALSLHESNVPVRNKGAGSKRLLGAAMQMKLHDGKNIALIDEVEVGLEPHRIRGLLYRLKTSRQQLFTTTHSSVVLRELSVKQNELYACKRAADGSVTLHNFGQWPDVQGAVRSNAEAFLGSKIIACEGATEIGCLRAYDIYRFDKDNPPVWSLATSYFNCGGIDRVKSSCEVLAELGYKTGTLCDNDAPEKLDRGDVESLRNAGIHVCQWDEGNSTERQLFLDLPWTQVPKLMSKIAENHDTLEYSTIVDCIVKEPRVIALALSRDPLTWPETEALRTAIGDLAHEYGWIKRIDYAEKAFEFALPLLHGNATTQEKLKSLWQWVQSND